MRARCDLDLTLGGIDWMELIGWNCILGCFNRLGDGCAVRPNRYLQCISKRNISNHDMNFNLSVSKFKALDSRL